MKTAFLSALALAASLGSTAAAPFDFQRLAFRTQDIFDFQYRLDRATLLADVETPLSVTVGGPGEYRSFSLDGTLDARSGTGFLTLSTPEAGAHETYVVDIRGNLGQDFFTAELDEIVEIGAFISVPVPDFRLDLRPFGGRDPGALFPNGFSISTPCERDPETCSPDDTGPVSALFSTGDPKFPTGYLFQNGPVELAPIPVPGAMGLSALALLSLGWAGYRRRG